LEVEERFAGGFVSIHAGEIPIDAMAARLVDCLTRFDAIVQRPAARAGVRVRTL
jgi:hypothetical protein